MEKLIFKHMETVRGLTLKAISELTEEEADRIPEGFNNNIRWNLGHVTFIQERVTLQLFGEQMEVPKLYKLLFAPGTSPKNWQFPAPSLKELEKVMSEQTNRIQNVLSGRLDEKLDSAFTNGIGLTFETIGECLLFTLYHEAYHMHAINQIRRTFK